MSKQGQNQNWFNKLETKTNYLSWLNKNKVNPQDTPSLGFGLAILGCCTEPFNFGFVSVPLNEILRGNFDFGDRPVYCTHDSSPHYTVHTRNTQLPWKVTTRFSTPVNTAGDGSGDKRIPLYN